jgi:hypothetical protein
MLPFDPYIQGKKTDETDYAGLRISIEQHVLSGI